MMPPGEEEVRSPHLAIFTIFCTVAAHAAAIRTESFDLEVPEGYEAVAQLTSPGAQLFGYIKKTSSAEASSLIQVTIYDLGSQPDVPANQMYEASGVYLLQFLGGIEARRSRFRKSAPEHVSISGVDGSKITWDGYAGDTHLKGVLYSVIKGSKVFSIRVEGPQELYTEQTAQAAKAAEEITLR